MEYKVDLEIVKQYIETNDISQRELARRMKIDNSTVIKVMSGERNPGIKFVQGLFNLGFNLNKVFTKKKEKVQDNKNTAQNICNYMNTMAMSYEKEYKLYEIYNIRNSIDLDRIDRTQNNIKVNGNTIEGRKKLNERISKLCNENFSTKLTYRDVQLYKKCSQLEAKDRNIINSMGGDENEAG
jgi:transcriptional regulator with XRE-family HTH domain